MTSPAADATADQGHDDAHGREQRRTAPDTPATPATPATSVPTPRTLGIEEEYLLVHPLTGAPAARADQVRRLASRLAEMDVQHELLQAQVEVATPVCATLDEAAAHLLRLRHAVGLAAEAAGCRLAACAAAGTRVRQRVPVTRDRRYRSLRAQAPQLVDEQLINGMHVHVAVRDRDEGVRLLNRLRPWLPLLLALSANSPFWRGDDTGFASWRHMVFNRWPVSGLPPRFRDAADYDCRVHDLVDRGLIGDTGQIYWVARLSERYPTLEIRVFDVQMRVQEAVVLAGLARALLQTLADDPDADHPAPDADHPAPDADRPAPDASDASDAPDHPDARGALEPEALQAALWQAARRGLADRLVDPRTGRQRPAPDIVRDLLAYTAPALDAAGDRHTVETGLERLLHDGNGAERQRRARALGGPSAVHSLILLQTAEGDPPPAR